MKTLSTIVLIVTTAALMSACGSSDDKPSVSSATANVAAPLDTADDAVRATKLLETIKGIADVAAATTEFSSPSFGKHYVDKVLKLTATDIPCSGGGSFDYDDQNRDDYRQFRFLSCTQDNGERVDGSLVLECKQGDFNEANGASCNDIKITLGTGSQPLSFILTNGQRVTLLGQYSASESQVAKVDTLDFEFRTSTANNRIQTLLLTNDLELRTEEDGTRIFVSGMIGADFVSDTADCTRGTVDILTRSALQLDESENLVGGEVLLSNEDNLEAIVSFSSDGSVTVNIAGATTSYSANQFERLCKFEG